MKKIRIENDKLTLTVENSSSEIDESWELKIKNIRVIGLCNRMISDEDTDTLIFVDCTLKIYHLTLSHISSVDYENIYLQLKQEFKLDFDIESSKNIDNCIIIYPRSLNGKKLYKMSKSQMLLTKLGIDVTKKLSLSGEVYNYINIW